jgi:hypothetical protein
VAKLSIVEEEADERLYWLRLLELTRFATSETSLALKVEANEILSIVVASKKTARKRGIEGSSNCEVRSSKFELATLRTSHLALRTSNFEALD